ncbi:MAG: hypothetical protein QM765_22455 [Myxococcales bacterium]
MGEATQSIAASAGSGSPEAYPAGTRKCPGWPAERCAPQGRRRCSIWATAGALGAAGGLRSICTAAPPRSSWERLPTASTIFAERVHGPCAAAAAASRTVE